GIDYRSDFYALGVTFYELLTGELPFKSDDAMELIHCHIAKAPPAMKKPHSNSFVGKERGQEIFDSNSLLGKGKPHPNPLIGKERGQEIPEVISDIVMKLMAKNAEDRYQSALGLKYDLEVCLEQFQKTGNIEYFEIAQRDICDRFIIPEKLYGRKTEVQELLAAFERVREGNSELMLVAGFSGIGKTAVVNEIHKPIVKQKGYFIKGKFDQFNRNIPFSAFVQALRNLMGQLLSEDDAQLSSWKDKILQALGENGQVIIDVIPELEQIIGKQAQVPELSGIAAQNRFNLLFQKFIQVFTTKQHPLVIFLDDLQWADSASLKLMKLLMSESGNGYLLLIGAYRNNEVFPAHPLTLTLSEIDKAQGRINTISLAPLTEDILNKLVSDALNCTPEISQPLTQLIYQKTQGNPFFSTQFLESLHDDGLIKFDFDNSFWECDISLIKSLSLTDDVVEFMALQLQKLPEETQSVLKLAACIGNEFDLSTLAIVCEQSEIETAKMLWKALQENLILPQSEVYKFYLESEVQHQKEQYLQVIKYKFLHDRVQEAAYSLIPEAQKQATHLKIGELLLNNTSESEREENIFAIVNQLNIGANLIYQQKNRLELAKLNLIAAKKAKSSTAYGVALKYSTVGIELLAKESWETEYELTLMLYLQKAEVEYFNGNFHNSSCLIEIILSRTKNILDSVKAYQLKIEVAIAQVQMQTALEIGLNVIKILGIELEQKPPTVEQVESLINLPRIIDEYKKSAITILMQTFDAAYIANPELLAPMTFTAVNLCIKYGNSNLSIQAFVCYALLLCGSLNDIETGYSFGKLSLQILEEFDATEYLMTKRRQRFVMDDEHPIGASQHQKIVVIDDTVAFSGGIDLTEKRWDTP
ncbi:MAG: AAA family ATPase, partial [Cyanobacteriota bacterium]|nr:AAA family ATPase [Cyanobacteriota bacterium]